MKTITEEIWLPVVGYEGRYSVSNRGRVRTEIFSTQLKPGDIRKPQVDYKGYLRVDLFFQRGEKPKHEKVHSLVMAAFRGPRPAGWHIDHLNRDRADCRLENLEYVTVNENNRRAAQVRKAA